MDTVIQLASALLVTSGLALLSRHLGYTRGYQHGLEDGRNETQQLKYHEGHADGLYEGRLKAQLEQETKEHKAQRDYDTGYQDALEDMQQLNSAQMASEATIRLSA